jgi:signal peptidase I
MEPSLCHGDVVLVRKADIAPFVETFATGEELTTRARILRIEGTQRSWMFDRPPVVLPGDVVVFCNPMKAFPNEYNIKRVKGVGGQMVRHSCLMNVVTLLFCFFVVKKILIC